MSGLAFSNSVFSSANTLSKMKPSGYWTLTVVLAWASAGPVPSIASAPAVTALLVSLMSLSPSLISP